jgi:NAD(P)-dependent dehydrogenase (short-subunit alcohol dehydrogenase family)
MAVSRSRRAASSPKVPATAVVFGVGATNGLGAALARRFAREGLHTVLVARTDERTTLVAEEIRRAGGRAEVVQADATKAQEVAAAFDVAEVAGPLALVVHNVGGNLARPLLDLSAETFETVWRQSALAGFLVGQESVRRFASRGQGTLIFTGATASLRARPPFTAFASAKAALRAVAQGIAREFGPAGIHAAHVVIDGVIDGDYAATNFPDFVAAKGADGLLAPEAIADAYWWLHRQPPSAWTHELDLRPFKEPF